MKLCFLMPAVCLLGSCIKELNYCETLNQKDESLYFDFSMRKKVQLNVNYGFEGYSVLCEVYVQNPINENFKKDESISAVYKIFTNRNSAFSGEIEVPSFADTLYLYSPSRGVNRLLKVPIENGVATYLDQQQLAAKSKDTRSNTNLSLGRLPRVVDFYRNLYSLYDEVPTSHGRDSWVPNNSIVDGLYSVLPNKTRLTPESTIGELMNRLNKGLKKTDNSDLVGNESTVNVTIESKMVNGKRTDGAHLDLVFLDNRGIYQNAIAYYYYRSNSNITAEEIKKRPKFLVLPRMASGMPNGFVKTRLQFFGEKGIDAGTDVFPAGYTVGWMLVPNLFPDDVKAQPKADLEMVEGRIKQSYANDFMIYSNASANYGEQSGCISLYDEKSKKIIIGFEDEANASLAYSDESFEDVLFYVDADPIEAVTNPDRPEVPVGDDEVLTSERTIGTLAFEDVWPTGGDYDLNDVIVEYESIVTFDQSNKIRRVEDIFRPVNKANSASCKDAFGYVINGPVGTVNLKESNFYKMEEENQIIVLPNVREVAEKNRSYRIVRDFSESIDKRDYKRDYNPFIVVNYKDGTKKRVEVHLPKMCSTAWGNQTLTGTLDDAFYVNKRGGLPFAIDVPVIGLEPVSECTRIGSPGEYPDFAAWAQSFGKKMTNWYQKKR